MDLLFLVQIDGKKAKKTIYYKRLSNQRVIKKMILEFAKCFQSPTLQFKQEDLIELAKLIDQASK